MVGEGEGGEYDVYQDIIYRLKEMREEEREKKAE